MSALRSIRGREVVFGYLFIMPSLLGLFAFVVIPVLASLGLSFCEWDLFGPVRFVGFRNFVKLAHDRNFWYYVLNTMVLMAAVPLTVVGSLFLALIMNQKLRGIKFFRLIFHLPTICAGVAIFVLWSWLYNNEIGLVNIVLRDLFRFFGIQSQPPDWLGSTLWAKPAIMLMTAWVRVGGRNVLLYLAALQNINPELYEAAEMDGARWWGKFWHITWPMVSPTTFFILVMSAIVGFQGGFEAAYVMTKGGPAGATTTVSYYIFNHAYRWFNMGYASAVAWLLFVIIFLITMIQWRIGNRVVHHD